MRNGDGDRGDGGGFGAENARAEGDGSPLMLAEERHLFGAPAAFGADRYGVGDGRTRVRRSGPFDRLRAGCGTPGFVALQCGGEGGGLFGFAEEDSGGGVFRFEGLLEGDGVGDLGDVGAAGLLGGFEGDAAPALGALES